MEQTLGKRIMENRKRLGWTQDRLAEQMGVSAQAVSKWENDQSCPDISLLPKLAELFGITVDELLGHKTEKVYEAEVVREDEKDDDKGITLNWEGGKTWGVAAGLTVLLTAALMIAANFMPNLHAPFWGTVWPAAMLVGGLVYMVEGFSFLKLGVAVMGGYFLLDHLGVFAVDLGNLVFPVLLVILGLSLLADALKKKRKRGKWQVRGKSGKEKESFTCSEQEGTFRAENSFGEQTFLVAVDKLNRGWAEVSFGESVVDLTGVDTVSENCRLDADVSFGEMTIRCPRRFRMVCNNSGSFGGMECRGNPDEEPQGVITLDGSTSFGSLVIEYI